jgi:hypothetical protein
MKCNNNQDIDAVIHQQPNGGQYYLIKAPLLNISQELQGCIDVRS